MPRNAKPRRRYTPRQSIYPDLGDVAKIFRPIHVLFDQLRSGEVDSAKGAPIFKDWLGHWCEVVPALEGWADCWERISAGEGLQLSLSAVRKLARRLDYDVPLTYDDLEAAWQEIVACKHATLKVTRRALGDYMRTEQIQIEVDRLGLAHAS